MSGLDAVNNFVNNAGAEANQTVGRMASRAGMSTTTLLWIGLAVLVVIGIVVAVILMLNKGKKASPGANANTTTNNTTAPPPAIERVVEKVVEKEVERVVYVPGPTRDVVINRYMPSTVITTTAPKAPPPPPTPDPCPEGYDCSGNCGGGAQFDCDGKCITSYGNISIIQI